MRRRTRVRAMWEQRAVVIPRRALLGTGVAIALAAAYGPAAAEDAVPAPGGTPADSRGIGIADPAPVVTAPVVTAPVVNESLPLRVLVQGALAVNPRVRAIQAGIRAAEARIPLAGALPDPMLETRVERISTGSLNPVGGDEKRVMLSQTFPGIGKRGAARDIAHSEADMLRWELAAVRNEITAQIATGLNDVHLVHARLLQLDDTQATLRLLANLSRSRYAVGTSGQDDYLRATIELSEVTAMSGAERARLHAASARVNLLADRDPDADLNMPEWRPAPAIVLDLDALKALALEVAPAIHASDAVIARARAAVDLAGRAGRPDLTVGLGWMFMKDMDDAWMSSLNLNLPVWRDARVGGSRREAEATLASAQAERAAARNELLLDVESAWARLQAAEINATRYREITVPQSDLAVSSNRYAYEHGKGDFARLVEAVRSSLRYRLEQEEALVERENAVAELARAVGDMTILLGESPVQE